MPLKAWVAVATLVLVTTGSAAASSYRNARFGFSVFYPESLLIPRPEPSYGDGRVFRSRSGRASFSVFAAYAAAGATPSVIEGSAEAACHGTAPALRVVRARLVAMSCIHDGLIYYAKVLIENGILTNLIAAYPVDERAVWDRVTTRMADSLAPAIR